MRCIGNCPKRQLTSGPEEGQPTVSVWSRIVRLLKIRLGRRNKPKDPLRVLQRDLALMDEKVLQVKRNSLTLGKHKIQLEHRIRDLEKHAQRYQDEARKALRLGREDLAQLALRNKQSTLDTREQLQSKVDDLAQRIADFERLKEEMANKIMIFKIKRDEIMLTRSTAQAELSAEEMRMGLSLEGGFEDSQEALRQMESEMRQIQSQLEATRQLSDESDLLPLDSDEPIAVSPEVAAELEALKQEVRRDGSGDPA